MFACDGFSESAIHFASGQPDDVGAEGSFVPGDASDEMCEWRLPALREIP